jgi:arylsulfatase A-like enzyme
MARLFHDAGYATAIAGKWQLPKLGTHSEIHAWGWDEAFVWEGPALPGEPDGRYWQPRYWHNGVPVATQADDYGPDLSHDFVVDFIRRHHDQPFFLYYPMVAVHLPREPLPMPLPPTPDSSPDSPDLYADNIRYMDKLIGQLVTELERLGLLHQTLLLFTGDNGYLGGGGGSRSGLVHGRRISGGKGSLLEGGSRVPLIAYWRGVTPQGVVLDDLIDFSDFYPTLAAVAGVEPPADVHLDGRNFAPQLRGRPGRPRQWVYVQLDDNWYVRNAEWKLYKDGGLYDMQDAPYREIFTPVTEQSPAAAAARQRLQHVLDTLQSGTDESP